MSPMATTRGTAGYRNSGRAASATDADGAVAVPGVAAPTVLGSEALAAGELEDVRSGGSGGVAWHAVTNDTAKMQIARRRVSGLELENMHLDDGLHSPDFREPAPHDASQLLFEILDRNTPRPRGVDYPGDFQ